MLQWLMALKMLALAVAASVVLSGCAVNPVTGESELMLLSEQDEIRLGQSTDQSVVQQYGLYDNAGLNAYIQGIGQDMGRRSHRPELVWQFKVMDSPVVNAFAAPGGYIYVTRGLLAAVNNEAELAGVLGHEIGHVTARHSAQQYSNKMLADLGLGLGQSLLGDYGDVLGPVMEAGAGLLFLKFSRDDEREADALGVEYATRLGYDAARMADFFTTLQSQPAAGGAPDRLPEFFSTHPSPVDREATVRADSIAWQKKFPGRLFAVKRGSFLNQVDGLVYGEDPQQGFQEGDWYYLPRYRVKMPVPNGWALAREGNNLQMTHPQKKAVVLFTLRPDSSIDETVAAFLQSTGAEVQQKRSFSTSGMSARLLVSTLVENRKRAVLVSRFFQRGRDVFAFHGMTDEAEYEAMSELIQQSAKGFSELSDPSLLNRRAQRVKVERVAKTASLESLLRNLKVSPALWAEIAWLNGLKLQDQVSAGEDVKILR